MLYPRVLSCYRIILIWSTIEFYDIYIPLTDTVTAIDGSVPVTASLVAVQVTTSPHSPVVRSLVNTVLVYDVNAPDSVVV